MPPNTSGEARAYPRPLPNTVWLGKLTEEILGPDLPIVDPHHHLWDHPGSRYLLDELLADVNSGHNIVATVFIQCGSGYRTSSPEKMRPIGESEFVRAIADESDRCGGKTKICAGIVSFADLRLLNVEAVLEGQIVAAGGRFRGIRQIAAYDPAISAGRCLHGGGQLVPRRRGGNLIGKAAFAQIEFATDSPLEGNGIEPSVPRRARRRHVVTHRGRTHRHGAPSRSPKRSGLPAECIRR